MYLIIFSKMNTEEVINQNITKIIFIDNRKIMLLKKAEKRNMKLDLAVL